MMENLSENADQRVVSYHVERYRFAAQFASGMAVLDVATGPGVGLDLLRRSALRVDGCDIKENVPGYDEFYCMPVECMPVESRYDLIVSFETIEHVVSIDSLLDKYWCLLRDEGRVVISFPNKWGLTEYHLTDTGWETVEHIGRYFDIESVYGQNRRSHPRPIMLNGRPAWVENIIVVARRRTEEHVDMIRRVYSACYSHHRKRMASPFVRFEVLMRRIRLKIKRECGY